MSTPNRFLRRIYRKPSIERRDILMSKHVDVLKGVATHFGATADQKKTKAKIVEFLLDVIKRKAFAVGK